MADDLGQAFGAYTALQSGRPVDNWMAKFAVDTKQLAGAVSGGIVRAAIAVDKNRTADVIVGRVGDEAAAEQLLQDVVARLKNLADRYREIDEKGARGIVAERSGQEPDFRRVVCLVYRGHLILANDSDAANAVIRMIARGPAASLEKVATVQSIRAKLNHKLPAEDLQLFWFYNPWAANPPDERAVRHGLSGIKGAGGTVSHFPDGSQALQTFVCAPGPRTGSLRMLDLTPDPQLAFPDWVVDERQHVVMIHGNIPTALERMGPVFDELFAEGAEGTYEDVLQDLQDPNGLHVDLKRQLFPLLGPHAVFISDCSLPSSGDSPKPTLVAIEARKPADVSQIVDVLMEGDRQASSTEVAGVKVWRVAAEGDATDSAATVALGYVMYSNDIRLVQKLLTADRRNPLERRTDFMRLKKAIVDRRGDLCALVARAQGGIQRAAAGPADAASEWRSPLDVLFADSWSTTFDVSEYQTEQAWLVFDRLPFLEGNRVAVGYLEPDGWSLLSGEFPNGGR
jgi:hypothetical protein